MTCREKDGRRDASGATNQGDTRESVREKEREGGCGEWKEYERSAEFPVRRKAELKRVQAAGGRSDYLQQSKQDKLSVCISV